MRYASAPPVRRRASTRKNRSLLRLLIVAAFALVAGLVIWLIVGGGGSSKSTKTTKAAFSEQGLQKLVAALNGPVYWAGPEAGARYELEQRSSGEIYLRYLSAQTKSGAATLTVGTYPMQGAYAKTAALGKKAGWTQVATGKGGVTAFSNSTHPLSVFFALPGIDRQIEVYDPKPGRAAALVQAGRVLSVAQGERLGLTLGELEQKVVSLEQTVYWIGSKADVTYEYMRTPSGNVYLRYLPKGVAVGASGLYPTVGTYPMKNAIAKTRNAAGQTGAVQVTLTGAEAFYTKSRPTSVYVAFEGSDYQIEVFDTVPARALAAVQSGQVKPVS
jgi:hypothetical protein